VLAPEPLEGDERLEQQREIARQHDGVLAQDRRYSVEEHPDFQILQLHVGIVEREFAKIGGEPSLVHKFIAAPVEPHFQHRLLLIPRAPPHHPTTLSPPPPRSPTPPTPL